MPGLDKGDIKINLTEDKLEISAEDSDNSKASYNNGILQITMPKTEIKKKTPLKVE